MKTIDKLHNIETAPEGSRALLKGSVADFGMLPNLHAVMAESPELLEAYKNLHKLFQQTSFSATEQTVIWQTINVAHGCHYCVAAHTAIGLMTKVDGELIEALRNQEKLADAKLQCLHETTLELVERRGYLSESSFQAFEQAGYTQKHLLEIILGIGQKVISNYVNHQAETPVDAPFQKYAWQPTAPNADG